MFSKMRGKVGSVVLRVVDGKQVAQEYNPNPQDAKSRPQVAQRTGMRMISQLGSAMLNAIRMGYSTHYYPYSKFIQENLKHNIVSASGGDEVVVNYGMLKIAEDTVHNNTTLFAGAVDYGSTTHLTVKVPFTIVSDIELAKFKVYLVVYSTDYGQAIISEGTLGTQSEVTCAVPSQWDGVPVYVYMFATAEVGVIDPDAVDTTHQRMPTYTTGSTYCGTGEIE